MNTSGFEHLETPALLLDKARRDRHGVHFRPHVKSNKCMDVTQQLAATWRRFYGRR